MSKLCICFLFSCLISVGLSSPLDIGCEPFWASFNGNCYHFLTHRNVNRKSAAEECQYHSANLLRIESMDEMAFVNSTVQNLDSSGFWTDMTDLRFDGTNKGTGAWWWGQYEPIDMNVITWTSYPTNNLKDSCGALDIQGFFQNWNCSMKFAYICEYPIPASNQCATRSNSSCFYFSNSSDFSDMHTWQGAKSLCLRKFGAGAKLATLDNAQDMNVVVVAASLPKVTTKPFWTGLVRNGKWSWDSGDKFSSQFVNWAKEPDHLNGNEHCGVLKKDGTFSDQNCNRLFNYACKKTTNVVNPDFYFGCAGWQRAGKKCYMFYESPWTNWTSARSTCLALGGDLLHVNSMDERIWLETQMLGLRHPRVYWTGLNDKKKTSVFVWADGSQANLSYVRWNSEPNSFRGDEDCAVILDTGELNDEDCFTHARVICEFSNNQNAVQCASGWLASPDGKSCYYFTSGHHSEYSWDDGYTFCTQTMAQPGGTTTLLAINTQNEAKFVKGLLSKQPLSTRGWWTGLNDRKLEGIWTYPESFNRANESLLNWGHEPRPSGGVYDCGMLMFGGRYFNRNCSEHAGFICEKMSYGQGSNGVRLQGSTFKMVLSAILVFVLTYLMRQSCR